IASGQAAEARFIAEDLVAREPWDRSNLERFRRALELLGEPDPEALIAERLSGQSPFMTTDLFLESNEFPSPTDRDAAKAADVPALPSMPEAEPAHSPAPPQASPASPPSIPSPVSGGEHVAATEPRPAPKRPAKPPDRSHFQISAHTIDLESILG